MITVLPVDGIGEVVAGTDLAAAIRGAFDLEPGDLVCVASKVVAKAEGRLVVGRTRAEVAHDETARVLVATPAVVVAETHHGLICANAGVDESNADGGVLPLPSDPDASAARLRRALGGEVAVIVTDTFGRPWRQGQTDVALGVAGMPALRDERGRRDRDGRTLEVTAVAVADAVAAVADLVRDKASSTPVVVVRGLDLQGPHGRGVDLVRGREEDLFPHGRGWLAATIAGDERQCPARSGPPAPYELAAVVHAVQARGGQVHSRGDGLRVTAPDAYTAGVVAATAHDALLDLDIAVKVSPRPDGADVTWGPPRADTR